MAMLSFRLTIKLGKVYRPYMLCCQHKILGNVNRPVLCFRLTTKLGRVLDVHVVLVKLLCLLILFCTQINNDISTPQPMIHLQDGKEHDHNS